jgi:hypothetical protein
MLSLSYSKGFENVVRTAGPPPMRYLERFQQVLFNPTWAESLDREPLLGFSHYLSGRVSVLCSFADEVIENLDAGFSSESVDGGRVARAEALMWFWLLGAYEVVRTMHQARNCFSERLLQDLGSLKRSLARARVPAAKMEKPGKRAPVSSNRSPSGWDAENRDLLMNNPEESPDISARWLLSEFDRLFSSIARGDVLARHEDAYDGGHTD